MDGFHGFRSGAVATFVVMLAAAISARGALPPQEIPALLADRDGRTFWVSARRIADEGPELLRGLDDPEWSHVGWLLDALASPDAGRPGRRPGADCLQYTGGVAVGVPRESGFDAQVITRTQILTGTVVASSDGLAWGSPETMLRVSVGRSLKGPQQPAGARIYVRYRSPRVEIAGVDICRPRGEELPPPPASGTTVLAMFYGQPDRTIAGEAVYYAGFTLLYDGVQDGRPTLMASDALLEGSPDWLVDATVAELADRVVDVLAAPDQFRASSERPTPPPADAASVAAGAAGPVRKPDPAGSCLLTGQCRVTPLTLAFDVFGVNTIDVESSTTLFDLDADGRPESTAWLLGFMNDAFLWMDVNRNGMIDGAHEFVGAPATDPRDDPGVVNSSFEILAAYDEPRYGGNGDGRIDRRDRVWGKLLVWNDRDDNGISEFDEIAPVDDEVVYFDTAYEVTDEWDGSINHIVGRGRYWIRGPRRDLRAREVVELALRFRSRAAR